MLPSLLILLSSTFLIQVSSGLLNINLPVALEEHSLSASWIGYTMAGFSVGVLCGCLVGGRLIQKASHIRSFAAAAAILNISALIYSVHYDPALWFVLRVLNGMAISVSVMVIESWLQHVSTPQNRSRILGSYMAIFYLGFALGNSSVSLHWLDSLDVYTLVGIVAALSMLPLTMSSLKGPPDMQQITSMKLATLFEISPIGVIGPAVAGMSYGALVGLGAVFCLTLGFAAQDVGIFIFAVIIGGFFLQYPIGKLSDYYDRRGVLVMVLLFSVCINCLALNFLLGDIRVDSLWTKAYVSLFAFSIGGTTSLIYPLSLAITFDWIDKDKMVSASAAVISCYAVGGIVGPLIFSFLLDFLAPPYLMLYFILTEGSLAAYVIYRQRVRTALPVEEQEQFVSIPRTTAVAATLDPRTEYIPAEEEIKWVTTPEDLDNLAEMEDVEHIKDTQTQENN